MENGSWLQYPVQVWLWIKVLSWEIPTDISHNPTHLGKCWSRQPRKLCQKHLKDIPQKDPACYVLQLLFIRDAHILCMLEHKNFVTDKTVHTALNPLIVYFTQALQKHFSICNQRATVSLAETEMYVYTYTYTYIQRNVLIFLKINFKSQFFSWGKRNAQGFFTSLCALLSQTRWAFLNPVNLKCHYSEIEKLTLAIVLRHEVVFGEELLDCFCSV